MSESLSLPLDPVKTADTLDDLDLQLQTIVLENPGEQANTEQIVPPAPGVVETIAHRERRLNWKAPLKVTASILVIAAATAAGIQYYLNASAQAQRDRVIAKKLAEEHKKQEAIEYVRAELPMGRKWAERATHWDCGADRKGLTSCLIAMEQWIGDVEKVRAYERENNIRLSVNDVSERLEAERLFPEIKASAVELRGLLEAAGPLVMEGGRRIFY